MEGKPQVGMLINQDLFFIGRRSINDERRQTK